MPAAIALGVIGIWLALQATAGRLAARILSYRELRPGEVPSPAPASSVSTAPSSSAPGGGIAGAVRQWAWPTSGSITSGYRTPERPKHEGIDIGAPEGTPVGAIGPGKVILARWNNGFGNQVQVDHGNGRVSSYAHLSRIDVDAGDQVNALETVGLVGNTGNSRGAHLHLEVRDNGTPIDPRTVVGGGP